MSSLIDIITNTVPSRCQVGQCARDSCSVRVRGYLEKYVLVNIDCSALGIPRDEIRCDYILVAEITQTTWIAPIELKSGRIKGAHARSQLEAGAVLLDSWLPEDALCRFVPILARKREPHPLDLAQLRQGVNFRGKKVQIVLLDCGTPVHLALRPSEKDMDEG